LTDAAAVYNGGNDNKGGNPEEVKQNGGGERTGERTSEAMNLIDSIIVYDLKTPDAIDRAIEFLNKVDINVDHYKYEITGAKEKDLKEAKEKKMKALLVKLIPLDSSAKNRYNLKDYGIEETKGEDAYDSNDYGGVEETKGESVGGGEETKGQGEGESVETPEAKGQEGTLEETPVVAQGGKKAKKSAKKGKKSAKKGGKKSVKKGGKKAKKSAKKGKR
jgi:hypothetical protein